MATRGSRRDAEGGRLASGLVVLGFFAVLGGVFALGVLAGRHWDRAPFLGGPAAAKVARSTDRPAPRRGGETGQPDTSSRGAEPPPLTFYQELTAPLASSSPPPRAPKPGRPEKTAAKPAEPRAAGGEDAAGTVDAAARYTIQVGAYRGRPEAEALRARLAASGHDAYVTETAPPGAVWYRVRVGSFATREAAAHIATQLAADGLGAPFVTTR